MVFGVHGLAAGVTTLGVISLLSGVAYFSIPYSSNGELDMLNADTDGAVAGRIVSVPVRVYRQAFKQTLKLGQCPLVMGEGTIKTCSDVFVGQEVHIAKGGLEVDVTRVQSSEDILTHIVGSVGFSVGVLGLISVNPKVTVATTTQTNRKSLNLLSSYEMNKGIITLQHPRPKSVQGDQALFLSEIEMGGSEMFLVTLEFESEEKKVEVEVSVTFKILFISFTAKLKYVQNTLKAKASCRIQFKSSWRPEKDRDAYYWSLEPCISEVEKIEQMYTKGPQTLRDMSADDEKLHYFYYFSSWKSSPYGTKFNLALINHDLDFLTEQNAEIKAVIQQINRLKDQPWSSDVKKQMMQLNQTLTEKTEKLTTGLDEYHKLSTDGRQKLRDIYGVDKAPQYYERMLNKIIA